MATNNPLSLNDAANAMFQSNPSFQNFAYGGTPVNGMLGGAVRPYMPVAGGLNPRNELDFARANSPKSYEQYVATNANPLGSLSREQYEQQQAEAIARVNNFTPDMLNMLNKNNSPANMLGGGMASAPQNTPATPLDQNFYKSQLYKDFQNNSANTIGTMDVYNSPYFGQQGSGSVGQAQDRAYEKYLADIGKPVANQNNFTPDMFNMFNGGNSSGNMFGAPGGYGYGSVNNPQNTAPTPTAGIGNQNNFNFTPTPIGASGSYDTSDYLSLLGGAYTGGVAGAAAGAGVNEAVGRLQALGQAGVTDYTNLAKTATEGINFTPYTLTSSLGTTQQTAPGVISQQLTPQQQANVNAAQAQQGSLYGAAVPNTSGIAQGAFGQSQAQLAGVGAGQQDLASLRAGYGTAAQGMTGMLGGSTTDMANQLFQQQQGMRNPEQQRQQLELENRLRAQGRLGTTTAAYGGTPEQLTMAKAIQEQQSADAFNSMTQAEQMATSQQARALGLGNATSTLAQVQQQLTTGDIANAQGLFNIGSDASQLPQKMQGENITQAGQLQTQALAPAAAQLLQAQQSGTMGQQQATSAYQAGGLFGEIAGTGLQERLTAESAASATRTKQFESILKSYAAQGGETGESANTIQKLVDSGVKKVGDALYDAGGKLLGPSISVIGKAATDMWNSMTGGDYPAGNNPDEVDLDILTDIGNSIGGVVKGGVEAIKDAYGYIFGD